MTTQLLATELANLIQESKRKHNDLRQVSRFIHRREEYWLMVYTGRGEIARRAEELEKSFRTDSA